MENEQEKNRSGLIRRSAGAVFWVHGGKAVVKAGSRFTNQVGASLNNVEQLAKQAKNRFSTKPTRIETFDEAAFRLGWTPEILAESRKRFVRSVWLLEAMTLFVFFYVLVQLANGHYPESFLGFIAFVIACCYLVRPLYRIWQIDKRYLGAFREFLVSKEWLPGSVNGEEQ